jgi:hypothetical protein
VPHIAELIIRIRAEGLTAIPRTPQGDGQYYSSPTLTDWREWKRRVARAR